MIRNDLFYSRVSSNMGVLQKSKDGDYFEMLDIMSSNKKTMYMSKKTRLEAVNYVVLESKIIVIDLMVFKDVSNDCRYVFEVGQFSIDIYRTTGMFEIKEENFYNDLTNPSLYNIMVSIPMEEFEKLTQNQFVMLLSSFNEGTGTIELDGNVRKTY